MLERKSVGERYTQSGWESETNASTKEKTVSLFCLLGKAWTQDSQEPGTLGRQRVETIYSESDSVVSGFRRGLGYVM